MASSIPLQGTDLVACAKANAKLGLGTASQQCGYGEDTDLFRQQLQQACQEIGVDIEQLSDLITDQQRIKNRGGIEISPDSKSDL